MMTMMNRFFILSFCLFLLLSWIDILSVSGNETINLEAPTKPTKTNGKGNPTGKGKGNSIRKCRKRTSMNYTEADFIAASPPQIVMTINERILFNQYLNGTRSFIEFGGGATTILACRQPSIRRIVTIATDQSFLGNLTADKNSCLYQNPRFIPHFVDIGPTGRFGFPLVNDTVKWKDYSYSLKDFEVFKPDFIFIDGRFRVACTLLALLLFQDPQVKIVIHDFYSRKQYYIILRFATIVDCVDNLVILQKRPIMDVELLEKRLEKFVKVPE